MARACNIDKNHPTILEPDKVRMHASICAERRALGILGGEAKGATVYVTRVMSNGDHGLSKPCDRCETALDKAGVRKVVYST